MVSWADFSAVMINNWMVISNQFGQPDQTALTNEVKQQLTEIMFLVSD
jgi:hypothetical protein